jgi:drug efflux transport system permease protein
MNRRRTRAIARKEMLHILRDPQSLIAALGMPILLLVLFGYALSLDVDRIQTAIYDQSHTAESQDLIHEFRASRCAESEVHRRRHHEKRIDAGSRHSHGLCSRCESRTRCRCAVVTGRQRLQHGPETALGYAESVVSRHSTTVVEANANRKGHTNTRAAVEPQTRIWYNAAMKSRNYIVPGLISVILMIIASLLTSLTIAREWENGTMEQLLSTPVRPAELLFGKLSAYFVIGVVDMLLSVGIGVFILHVPFRGSFILLFIAGVLFLAGSLCWGLFLSAATRSQHESYQLATLTSFLPAFLLSGFIYAIENMAGVIQAFTYLIPARYFVTILKGIFLKGVGLSVLWAEFAFLTAYAVIIMFFATRKLRQKIA